MRKLPRMSRASAGDVDEIAALLRVSRATVYRLIKSGALTAIDVGRSVRVTRRAVDDFLRRHARPAVDPPGEFVSTPPPDTDRQP